MSEQQQGSDVDGEDDASRQPPPDFDYYTIPTRSSWFRWDQVHQTEIDAFPEFFDSISISRSPRVYKEYRDFIINKYREDPSRLLTFTDVRKSLVGDTGTLRKVFEFLHKWGLINFSVSSRVEDTLDGVDCGLPTVVVEDGPPNGVRIVANPTVGKGVELLSDILKRKKNNKKNEVEDSTMRFKFPPLTSYSDVFNVKGEILPVCGKCGEHCISEHHELKRENMIICTKCFGKSDKDSKSDGDLMFMNDNCKNGFANSEWTDVETMHLLEAVVAKKNDWAMISDQTRRTKLDCVVKLVQLPLLEHFLGTLSSKNDGSYEIKQGSEPSRDSYATSNKEHTMIDGNLQIGIERKKETEEDDDVEPPLKKNRIMSWSDATNSLMRQVADVAKIAGPDVAASAAEAAIVELCKESPYARKVFLIGNGVDSDLNSFSRNNYTNSYNDHMIANEHESHTQSKTAEDDTPENNFGHLAFRTRASIATAFGCLSAHAKLLSDQEDREIGHLMASLLETQMKKILCKVKHFDELQIMMEKEYVYIQQQKESVLSEWIDVLEKANNTGIFKRQTGFSNPVPASPL